MFTEQKTDVCPFCKESIEPGAVKCKHCGSRIAPIKPSHNGICPYCKETIHPEATRCKHCQSNLIASTATESVEPGAMRGLGDAVARFTTFLGLKPCAGCKRRQERLNSLVPFSRSH